MPDQPSDAATADAPGLEPSAPGHAATRAERRARAAFDMGDIPQPERAPRTDWRLGGRTVHRWRESLLAIALLSLCAGLLAGTLVDMLWDAPWAAASATALVWIGMLVPVVRAFSRSRPIGLLRFRALDLLYGVVLGLMLRIVQGWLEVGLGGSGALPSTTLVDGRIPATWWLTDGVAPIAIAAPLEELFFRAVVLVVLYTMMRRPFGKTAAAVVAILASTALFVMLHALTGVVATDAAASLLLLGLVCATLVVLTGRIWGAIVVHVVYNATYAALTVAGSVWS